MIILLQNIRLVRKCATSQKLPRWKYKTAIAICLSEIKKVLLSVNDKIEFTLQYKS